MQQVLRQKIYCQVIAAPLVFLTVVIEKEELCLNLSAAFGALF
jgi:hypothetical protein